MWVVNAIIPIESEDIDSLLSSPRPQPALYPQPRLLITYNNNRSRGTTDKQRKQKGVLRDSSELIAANQVPCSNIYHSSNTTTTAQ
jgi:hypothetical protein